MPIKTLIAKIDAQLAAHKARKHAAMIEASKAHLAETTLVPGYTNIYA